MSVNSVALWHASHRWCVNLQTTFSLEGSIFKESPRMRMESRLVGELVVIRAVA